MRQLSKSLEIAIQGVEAFNKKGGRPEAVLLGPRNAAQENSLITTHLARQDLAPVVQPVSPLIDIQVSSLEDYPAPKRFLGSKGAVFAAGLSVVLMAVSLELLGSKLHFGSDHPTPISPKVDALSSPQLSSTTTEPRLPSPSALVPSAFGIYAVSAGKLYELDVLPGRAPDARVAISSLITRDSHATVPDGHVTFIVYLRDSATNAVDRAEVRVVARIEREMSFDKNGAQVVTSVDNNWVMRNISIPFRTAPKKESSDMYEVRNENPDTPLAPGRYALVIRGLAYDFNVGGQVTDPRQCLERLTANNGRFYSECKKQQ